MKLLPALGALALAACTAATPPPQPIGTPDGVPADCPLTVTFASYGAGIDGATYAAVERLLAKTSFERHRWGREGEVTLCVRPASDARARALFGKIKTAFPAKPRGPLSVSTVDGLSYRSPAED